MVLRSYCKVSTMFENSFTTTTTSTTSTGTTTKTTSSPSPSPEPEKQGSSDSCSKKRRKQSNPTRYGNISVKKVKNSDDITDEDCEGAIVSGDGTGSRSGSLSDETRDGNSDDDRENDQEEEEVSSRPDLQFPCPHCPASFSSDQLFKAHIDEEHVIQLLERQFRQYQFGRNGHNGSAGDVHQELAEHHLSVLMGQQQQRNSSSLRPGSRTSSRSSSLSPESPTSQRSHNRHQLRNECMEREMGNMLPFPLSSLATGPDGKPIPMGMFPPFLFPVMPGSGASSGGPVNGSVGPSVGQSRANAGSVPTGSGSFCIFNPEAYCELCNKEFCNKYFLKTHKANKHGIYTGDPPTSSSCPVSNTGNSNSNNSINNPSNNVSSRSPTNSPGPPAASSDRNSGSGLQAQVSAAAAAASAFFPAGLVSQSPTEGQQQLMQQQLQQQQQQQQQQHQNNMSGTRITGPPVNPESFCEICQKAFCNKYFLKKHKHKIHGIHSEGSAHMHASASQSQDSLSSSPGRLADQPKSPVHSLEASNGKGGGELSSSSNGVADPYGGIGLKDFCNKYFSGSKERKHKLQQDMFDIQAVVNNIQKAAAAAASVTTGHSGEKSNLSSPGVKPPPLLSRSPTPSPAVVVTNPASSSPKNYCNICNKELCNKYFMKTHMLKMHGINIDEQPGEAAQASTIGGVTCDICQKELCSKYFLKVHKQNTHGIYEESAGKESRSGRGSDAGVTESPNEKERDNSAIAARGIDPKDTSNRYFSHYTEVCPMCQRRFKSIKWLKTHVMNDHSDGLSPITRAGHHHQTPEQDSLALLLSPSQESPTPHTGSSSLPPDFACLNWLRSHIPPDQMQSQVQMQHPSDAAVKREPQSNCNSKSEVRKRETLSPPSLSSSLPAISPQFAIPQKPVAGGSFFMQAFNISEPDEADGTRPTNFVPSLVYLPVARQVKHPLVVAFQLTPA